MERSPWTRIRFDDPLLALLALAIALLAIVSLLQLVTVRRHSTLERPVVPVPAEETR